MRNTETHEARKHENATFTGLQQDKISQHHHNKAKAFIDRRTKKAKTVEMKNQLFVVLRRPLR